MTTSNNPSSLDSQDDKNKCAHPSCECLVSGDGEFGSYCSSHCHDAEDIIELRCDCDHPGCRS